MIENTATQISESLAFKKISAVELLSELFKRIKAVNPKINSYLTTVESDALLTAKKIDEKRAKGESLGRLAGIPVAVKDNICTTGIRTTCSSKILENFVPPYDAFVISKLKKEDAIIVGKTNLDEFAMGSSTENSAFGATKNPWNTDMAPGGSSGGSAAAVASSIASVALGSDTGGSIRQPASFCSVVGFKPTYGVVSRYGLVAFASSLDQIGPMTKCVDDCAMLMDVLCEKDGMESTSVGHEPVFAKSIDADLKGLRIGLPREYFGDGVDSEILNSVNDAAKRFEKMGAKLSEVNLPTTKYGIAAYYVIAPSEASSNLARYDGIHYGYRDKNFNDIISLYSNTRKNGFGPEVTRRIMLGTFALSSGYYDAYYLRALKTRRLIKNDFDSAFEKVDVIIGPTSPIPPFKLGDKVSDPLQMYLCDVFTVATNLAGLPAVSIPCGFTKAGLPIGLQIQGRPFDDVRVLQTAKAFERESGLYNTRPKI